MNYAHMRICAVEGSSVNISSEYSHPHSKQPISKDWYKIRRSGGEEAEKLTREAGRLLYHDLDSRHMLQINNLRNTDSAEYALSLQRDEKKWKMSDYPEVTLVVTGNHLISNIITEVQ